MDTINLDGHEIAFTTDHAASSYGVPVLVIDGGAYGPSDETPIELAGRTCGLGIVRYLVEGGYVSPDVAALFGDYRNVTR